MRCKRRTWSPTSRGSLFQARRCKFPPNNHSVDSPPTNTTSPHQPASNSTLTMDLDKKNPTHDQIWDDSALVDSWNSALDEYQVRPSSSPLPGNHQNSMTDDDAKPPEIPQHPCQRRRSRRSFGSRARRQHQVSAGVSPSGAIQLTHAFLRTAAPTTGDAKPETSDPIAATAGEATAPQDTSKVMKIKRDDACLSVLSSKLFEEMASHLIFFPIMIPADHPSRSQKLGMKHGSCLEGWASRPSREFVLGLAGLELLKHLGEGTLPFYIRKMF